MRLKLLNEKRDELLTAEDASDNYADGVLDFYNLVADVILRENKKKKVVKNRG